MSGVAAAEQGALEELHPEDRVEEEAEEEEGEDLDELRS